MGGGDVRSVEKAGPGACEECGGSGHVFYAGAIRKCPACSGVLEPVLAYCPWYSKFFPKPPRGPMGVALTDGAGI